MEKWNRIKHIYNEEGIYSVFDSIYHFTKYRYFGFEQDIRAKYYDVRAVNIYERDWDVLLILDACRADAILEVSDEYDFLEENIDSIISVGGGTPEWVINTFTKKYMNEISNTAYITGNSVTDSVLGGNVDINHEFDDLGGSSDDRIQFKHYNPVWRRSGEGIGAQTDSSLVTDALIKYYRKHNADRVIAHYVQPHLPIRAEGYEDLPPGHEPFEMAEQGEISRERLWNAHLDNLRYVLDDIKTVLNNIDAQRVVISADHGEALGEGRWNDGNGQFGHGRDHLGVVRRVPWVEVSANDKRTYFPELSPEEAEGSETEISSHLKALGYE